MLQTRIDVYIITGMHSCHFSECCGLCYYTWWGQPILCFICTCCMIV